MNLSSPIAHESLMFVAWPVVARKIGPRVSPLRRGMLAAAVGAALLAPDADALIGLVKGESLTSWHNQFTHSLFAGVVFAVPFGLFCGLVARRCVLFFSVIGFVAYASHVLIDACTFGRGVQLLWPITDARFSAPLLLFYGVRHSVNASFGVHLLTVANDLVFAIVAWWIGRRIKPGQRRYESCLKGVTSD